MSTEQLRRISERSQKGKRVRNLVRMTRVKVRPHIRRIKGKAVPVAGHVRMLDLMPAKPKPSVAKQTKRLEEVADRPKARHLPSTKAEAAKRVAESYERARIKTSRPTVAMALRSAEQAWGGPEPYRQDFLRDVNESWDKINREPKMRKAFKEFGEVSLIPGRRWYRLPEQPDPMPLVVQAQYVGPGIVVAYDGEVANDGYTEDPGRGDALPEKGALLSGTGWPSIFRHEYGHHVSDQIFADDPGTMNRFAKMWHVLRALNPEMDWEPEVDTEGVPPTWYLVGENPDEGFAEAFSLVMHPEFRRERYRGDPGEELLDFVIDVLKEKGIL